MGNACGKSSTSGEDTRNICTDTIFDDLDMKHELRCKALSFIQHWDSPTALFNTSHGLLHGIHVTKTWTIYMAFDDWWEGETITATVVEKLIQKFKELRHRH